MNDYQRIIAEIAASLNLPVKAVIRLIDLTTDMERIGARFARFNGYWSDVSDNSELASHTVQVNFSYANMLQDERNRLATFNVATVDVERYHYSAVDYASQGYNLDSFKRAVSDSLSEALRAMNSPKQPKDTSADKWLNKIMVWNENTKRFCMVGEEVSKTVVERGEFKIVKSVPLTVAKNLIRKQANLRSDKYRRFALDNFDGNVKMQGETIEIGVRG